MAGDTRKQAAGSRVATRIQEDLRNLKTQQDITNRKVEDTNQKVDDIAAALNTILEQLKEASRKAEENGEPVEPSSVEIQKQSDLLPPNFKAIYKLVEDTKNSLLDARIKGADRLEGLSAEADDISEKIDNVEKSVEELQELVKSMQPEPSPVEDFPMHGARGNRAVPPRGRKMGHSEYDDIRGYDERVPDPRMADASAEAAEESRKKLEEQMDEWTRKTASLAMNIIEQFNSINEEIKDLKAPAKEEVTAEQPPDKDKPTKWELATLGLSGASVLLTLMTLVAVLIR